MIVVGSFSGASMTIGTTTLNAVVSASSSQYNNYLAKWDSSLNLAYLKVGSMYASAGSGD